MKRCPFCQEKIQDEAIKCKHCGEFLTKQENIELISQYKFPKTWIGYIIAGMFFIGEIIELIASPQTVQQYTGWSVTLWLVSLVYWFMCVYSLHKTILKMTDSHYPIHPARAVGYSFIPIYNLYWIFKWPGEIIRFVNSRDTSKKLKDWLPGFFLLIGAIGARFDGSFGILLEFLVLSYLIRELKKSLIIQAHPVPYSDSVMPISRGAKIALISIISIPILALLAAITIPNLLRARLNANETSAIATLKNYYSKQQVYRKENLSYEQVTTFVDRGYTFTTPEASTFSFKMEAMPITYNVTGSRKFEVDETGVITSNGKVIEYLR
ncbi:MAG: zinc ribbon domain-containing protein [Candidatus Omnitrophota bacterium]